MPADSANEIVKFTISIRRGSCTNAKAKYSSSVVPPDPSVHFYHWVTELLSLFLFCLVKLSQVLSLFCFFAIAFYAEIKLC